MLKVIKNLPDISTHKKIVPRLQEYYDEVRVLLPNIPENMNIYFDNWCLIDEQGTGGYAYSPDTLTIAFDINFSNKKQQLVFLRETIFHEAMHLAQGYTGETLNKGTPLEETVYEGVATVFERDIAGSTPGWGNYQEDKSLVKEWIDEVKNLKKGYDGAKWWFYNPDTKQRWIMYKIGTYIVDKALAESGKTIIELSKLSPKEVLKLAEVA